MDKEEYFDYLMQTFHEEHNLARIILVGEDLAVRVLTAEELEKGEEKNE